MILKCSVRKNGRYYKKVELNGLISIRLSKKGLSKCHLIRFLKGKYD